MNDIEYILYSDNRERKRTAYGARNKKRGGRKCSHPGDYLTRKEKAKMNGDVISYNPKQITWAQFRSLPETAQRDLIETWKSHGARHTDVAALMGTNSKNFSMWMTEHLPDMRWGQGSGRYPSFEWNDWRFGKTQENVTVLEPEEKPESKKEILPTSGTLSYTGNPAEILKMVGAMLTGGEYEITVIFRKAANDD